MSANIVVGDIGSTKSTWWTDIGGEREILLDGYNPVVHADVVGQDMVNGLKEFLSNTSPAEIRYYGAGVVDLHIEQQIRDLFSPIFPKSKVMVASDLIGAARATCGANPGVVAILGTGSHAAVYDGSVIARQANALGYLLGDEGSGCDIGKNLIQHFFYGTLSPVIQEAMKNLIRVDRAAFLKNLYQHPAPNQFLAGFARVAVDHMDHLWVQTLVKDRFQVFVERHILPLDPTTPIHVVGSIGFIFADLFRQVLLEFDLTAGEFIRDPARRLFELHLAHE